MNEETREYISTPEREALAKAFLEEEVETPEGYYWDENGELQEIVEEIDYKYVLGLDPGGTTGVAMLRYTDATAPELIYLHQIENGKEGFLDYFEGSGVNENLTIVSENFTIREGVHGADVTPLYIEGVQYALWRDEVVYQEPLMKSLVPDEWLHEQNLWTPGKRHQMDALIHAIVYLRNNDHRPTQRSLSGDEAKPIAEEGEAEKKQLKPEDAQPGEPDEESMEEIIAKIREAMKEAEKAESNGEGDDEGESGEADDMGDTAEAEGAKPSGGGGDADDQTGPSNGASGAPGKVDLEGFKGTRKRKEKNGVFAGFETEDDGIETELFSD